MTILDRIKEMKLSARKARDSEAMRVLTYIQGELERKSTDIANKEALKILASLSAKMKETGDTAVSDLCDSLILENSPRLLSEEMMKAELVALAPADLKTAMAYFKAQFPDMYEGKVLKTLVYDYLKEK